jgi:hypothetical protein
MAVETVRKLQVHLRVPHGEQERFIRSKAKRKIIRAGRRGGKTVGAGILGNEEFAKKRRILYAAPTSEQTGRFWYEITTAYRDLIDAKVIYKNETERYLEWPKTEGRIKCKTAWNANTLRGDYADLLIVDEFQLVAEDLWNDVGAPMLMDNNGDAVFIYTPPSLRSTGVSKAIDPRHASKMFKAALEDKTGRWEAFHFTSFDNPYISQEGLDEVVKDMSMDSYRKEILAEDDDIENSWLVYGVFNGARCIRPRSLMPAALSDWPVYTGHDFGISNPAALFMARDPANGDIHIFKEYLPGGGKSIAQHVEAFKGIMLDQKPVKSVGGNVTTEDEIRQGYTAHGWNIMAPVWTKPAVQIERTIALMERNRIIIYDDLHNLLAEIANCLWELDDENRPTVGKIKDESKYHLLAALRYIASDFTQETQLRSIGVMQRRLSDYRR